MRQGRQKEKKIANNLTMEDISTIVATLSFFETDQRAINQTVFDLAGPARFRVFDWLSMGINREVHLKEQSVEDSRNIWVALGNTYVNTTAVQQFVNSCRYNDLQLWEGKFTSKEFISYLQAWNRDDVKIEKRLAERGMKDSDENKEDPIKEIRKNLSELLGMMRDEGYNEED